MSKLIRQLHRWLSMVFMAGVIANTVVIFGLGQQNPPFWVYLLALIPLFALMASGTYMFFLPHFAKGRGAAGAVQP